MGDRIGLLGGSFNPIHCGHLIAARSVAEQLGLSYVAFLPSATPPHKDVAGLINAQHRAEMVRLALAEEAEFLFSDVDLQRIGPTYTIDTVRHFRRACGPDAELFWIIGHDSLADLPSWRCIGQLVDECTLVTVSRPDNAQPDWSILESTLGPERIHKLRSGLLQTPLIDISSTDIRQRIRQGRSVRYLVPDSVNDYMIRNRLFREGESPLEP